MNLQMMSIIAAPHSVFDFHLLFFSPQPSLSVRESATLPAMLAIGCGFVLEALENRSLQLATSLLTQMVH